MNPISSRYVPVHKITSSVAKAYSSWKKRRVEPACLGPKADQSSRSCRKEEENASITSLKYKRRFIQSRQRRPMCHLLACFHISTIIIMPEHMCVLFIQNLHSIRQEMAPKYKDLLKHFAATLTLEEDKFMKPTA